MKYLLIAIFIVGSSIATAEAYGSEGKEKRAFWIIAGLLWLFTLVLANTLIN